MADGVLDVTVGKMRVLCQLGAARAWGDQPGAWLLNGGPPMPGDLVLDSLIGGPPAIVRKADRNELARALLCPACEGRGSIRTYCPDPQCGDSTWDHDCEDGYEPCPQGCKPPIRQPVSRG